jgi:fructose-bisphosphate aldolase, class II
MTGTGAEIDRDLLRRIGAETPDLPLVLHGGSGIAPDLRRALARQTTVCKFNIGTELRQVFGQTLRQTVLDHPDRFDRNQILKETIPPLVLAARRVIRGLAGD